MLENNTYDKIKLLHKLSCIVWFIENHAKADAKKANDMKTYEIYEKLSQDVEKYVHQLKDLL